MTADGTLQLRWFDLRTSSPTDDDLLAADAAIATPDWPAEMHPARPGETPSMPLLGL